MKKSPDNPFHLDPSAAAALVNSLTPRERQTAECIAMGIPHAESARQLGISPKTMDIFRGKVKRKLGCEVHGVARVWFCAMAAQVEAAGAA